MDKPEMNFMQVDGKFFVMETSRWAFDSINKIGYYIKDGGGTIEDVIYTDCVAASSIFDRFDVEEVCDWIMEFNDGFEWLRTGVILTLVIDGKEVGDYKITVEYEPTFYAEKQGDE